MPEVDGSNPARFFFVHVHKAAGTSLLHRLRHQFARDEIYPDESDVAAAGDGATPLPHLAPTLLVSHLEARYRVRRDRIALVAGHFPLRTTEILGDPFTTMTLVREPVERILSALRHHRVHTPADADRPLEELYDDPIRFHGMLHNHLVKMFSLSPDEIRLGDGMMAHVRDFTPARLAEAKQRLAGVDVARPPRPRRRAVRRPHAAVRLGPRRGRARERDRAGSRCRLVPTPDRRRQRRRHRALRVRP